MGRCKEDARKITAIVASSTYTLLGLSSPQSFVGGSGKPGGRIPLLNSKLLIVRGS
jgi:hypothetical protein